MGVLSRQFVKGFVLDPVCEHARLLLLFFWLFKMVGINDRYCFPLFNPEQLQDCYVL